MHSSGEIMIMLDKQYLDHIIAKHWEGMLVDEQMDAWAYEDLWGENYLMDAAHAEESVKYFLSEVEETTEVKDLYSLLIDYVDWQDLVKRVQKAAFLKRLAPKSYTYSLELAKNAFEAGSDVWVADIDPVNDTQLHSLEAIDDADGHMFYIKSKDK